MLGIAVFAAFCAGGVLQAMAVCRRRGIVIRIWLGLTAGLMEMMWLPSLFAFAFDFTLKAQIFALGTEILLSAFALIDIIRRPDSQLKVQNGREPNLKISLLLLIPVVLLAGYLQYTHTLRCENGALYCGQSTYGDLSMHLSFATGLIGQSYPPEYTLLQGATLGYPFLVDALSSTMLIFGTPLALAFTIPGTVMIALVYYGFYLFAREITKKEGTAALSVLLLLFSGGLGFLSTLNLSGDGFTELKEALYGYYTQPANLPDENIVWVNTLCDLLIPQRTLMAGWMCAIPALYLLYTAMKTRRKADFLALGLWTGPMVMIHTHSFLAVGVISLGAMVYTLAKDGKHRGKNLFCFCLYGFTACLLALPQLLVWTFPQTVNGGSLRLLFNWMNNNGDGTLKDGYFWFWIKNVGPMFLLLVPAVLSSRSGRMKALGLGSLFLFALAESVVFQPNTYDNNKLFYVAYLCCLPCAAGLLCDIYAMLKKVKLRAILAAAFLFTCFASGIITIAAECMSSYQLFSASQVNAAEYLKENTPEDAVVLTANNHNNAPAALAGKNIVCGSSLYLYFHGLDYQTQEAEAILMLAYPEQTQFLYEKYAVDYIYVSSYERQSYKVWNGYVWDASMIRESYTADEDAIADLYPLVYEDDSLYETIRIYAVSQRAQELLKKEGDYAS